MHVVVGLGNPGPTYYKTRHNLGWMVLEYGAHRWGISTTQKGQTLQGKGKVGGHGVILARPLIWMNQTGEIVASLLQTLDLNVSDLILVYDDLDLPLGVLKIKNRGGAGGHNGVRSVIACLGTQEFCRLKVGIDRPPPTEDPAHYVLSEFEEHERESVDAVLPLAVDAIESVVREGITAAMNRFNSSSTRNEIE